VRFHLPRTRASGENRDPLHDDVFDVEVNGSYTLNERANTIELRFADNGSGGGSTSIPTPAGYVPPNSDRWNGYMNSVGLRVGGQWNVVQDRFAIRAGTWFESQSQEAQWLNIGVVGGVRGGFGGGLVLRRETVDISLGYQHHWSQALDNGGFGGLRAPVTGVGGSDAAATDLRDDRTDAGKTADQRRAFRTAYTVNDGRMTQSANVFTLGATVRF